MKKTGLIIMAGLCCLCAEAKAPKWLKKTRKAQVTVIAFDKENAPHEAQGVFVDEQGTVLTEYDIFRNATKATVIDASGKEYDVHRIMGANSMYNVIKLAVNKNEKSKIEYLQPDTSAVAQGSVLYILPTAKADKSVPCTPDSVIKEEPFKEHFHYYTLAKAHGERLASCPVMNEAGSLVGLLQLGVSGSEHSFVIDASYAAQLQVSPMDANNADQRNIHILKTLPDNASDAATFIFLTGTKDSTAYMQYVDDYIKAYPDSAMGYVMKAEALVEYKRLDEAERAYNDALAKPNIALDEVHFSWAKNLYYLNLDRTFKGHAGWTMEKALEEAEAADKVKQMPIYRKIQADCLYTLKQYDKAGDIYLNLTQTNLRNPDLFLYAAQCIQVQDSSRINDVIALQDSALNCFPKPYPAEAAPVLLMHANNLAKAGKYRQAITELIIYEKTYQGILSAEFYYQREQLALKSRVYPTALNDITHAIRLQPDEPVFRAELAAICYRIDRVDDAIEAANIALKMDPEFADAYRILGACYNKKGNKAEAQKNLRKAMELGDTIAKELLEKK